MGQRASTSELTHSVDGTGLFAFLLTLFRLALVTIDNGYAGEFFLPHCQK